MTRWLALAALLTAATGLAACDRDGGVATGDAATGSEAVQADVAPSGNTDAPKTGPAPATAVAPSGDAIEGAPAFAVIYPGGTVETTPLTPIAAGGAGGGVVFSSEASPDEIVEFYRHKAEAAGLATVMSMNRGEARGYGATGAPGGASLQVMAHPVEPGRTSVQVTWGAGQ